jgi:hypothetical protein
MPTANRPETSLDASVVAAENPGAADHLLAVDDVAGRLPYEDERTIDCEIVASPLELAVSPLRISKVGGNVYSTYRDPSITRLPYTSTSVAAQDP